MKKISLAAILLLIAIGSWAFYPKATEQPGYMMLLSTIDAGGYGSKVMLTTLAPDGARQERVVKFKNGLTQPSETAAIEAHRVELEGLNELSHQGWHLVSTTPTVLSDHGSTRVYQTVYLLDKR
jgi:hypothetical protein